MLAYSWLKQQQLEVRKYLVKIKGTFPVSLKNETYNPSMISVISSSRETWKLTKSLKSMGSKMLRINRDQKVDPKRESFHWKWLSNTNGSGHSLSLGGVRKKNDPKGWYNSALEITSILGKFLTDDGKIEVAEFPVKRWQKLTVKMKSLCSTVDWKWLKIIIVAVMIYERESSTYLAGHSSYCLEPDLTKPSK